jgi:CHASE3 domain sensor protein|tara:strand:+ start:570 stop:791 length:222 start_codon:yes stop_codon:yes gene_type:complete
MKYARQTQEALDRLDQALAQLRGFIKRGENQQAIRFMEEGALKERFEELQNMISVSSSNPIGSRGTAPQTGRL